MATMVTILKILKRHLLPNVKSDWAETWWEAFEKHGDSELLNSFHPDFQDGCDGGRQALGRWRFRIAKPFCYDIHDGCHSSHLEDLQLSAYAMVCWSWSVPHPYICQQLFTFSTFPSELYPWWLPWWPSWKSSVVICSWTVRWMELKIEGKHWGSKYGDLELQKWFRSDIQDGHHGSHLESLQITSAPEQ